MRFICPSNKRLHVRNEASPIRPIIKSQYAVLFFRSFTARITDKIIIDGAKSKTGDFVSDGLDTINKKGDKLKSAIKAGIDTYKNEKGEHA